MIDLKRSDLLSVDLLYLASPYSHSNPDIVEQRYLQVEEMAAKLMVSGAIAWSPIAHSHLMSIRHDLPKSYEYWHQSNLRQLAASTELVVCLIDGWKESIGLRGEVKHAVKWGIKISQMDPNGSKLSPPSEELMRLIADFTKK